MKLLGWTIVASGLILGLAACTVTSDDPTATDGGTGGTAGSGGSSTGGTAGAATGGTAGAATGGTAGAATGGTAGGGGAGTCTPQTTDSCDVCMNSKCCAEITACANDKGDPDGGWTSKCQELWDGAVDCANAEGGTKTFQECLQEANTDYNQPANDLNDCVFVSKCTSDC